MLNRIVLVGRLTKDPELRKTQNDISVTQFTLAVNRNFKSQDEQEADFINVVTWRNQADNVAKYVSKGSLVGLDGRIQTRNYENKEGQRVFVTEVVADSVQFLDTKPKEQKQEQKQEPKEEADIDIPESDLPF